MAQEKIERGSARMGEMPEGRLLLTMAIPMMLSMLVQALYNVVDSIYVSRVSEDCLTALSLAFPAQNIMIGLGTGTGVGISTLISRALGQRNREQASRVAGNGMFLAICCWLLMVCFGVFVTDWFVRTQTDIQAIRGHADSYLRIVTICSLFLYVEILVERLLQSTGRTRLSKWTQMIGAVTHIILDPFFNFGWLGLPAMGTAGAALATVIGQAVGSAVGLAFHFTKNQELPLRFRDVRPDGKIIGEVYKIGIPSILMMIIGSFTNFMMNRILGAFQSTAVAVFGAYFKVQSFFFMPIFGLNNGMIPILGYNYGARKLDRIHRTIRFGILFAVIIMFLGLLVFQFFPQLVLAMFDPSPTMLEIGTHALRRISISFLLAGFCIISGSACQALNKSIFFFFISVLRQVVGLIPAAWLLARTGDVNMVWWAFPIAEAIAFVATIFFLRKTLQDVNLQLREA